MNPIFRQNSRKLTRKSTRFFGKIRENGPENGPDFSGDRVESESGYPDPDSTRFRVRTRTRYSPNVRIYLHSQA